jgi:5-methylcytosine-specific restriction endonuclease McrA
MSATTRRLLLLALATHRRAELRDGVWEARCLHCRSRLLVSGSGAPIGRATVEHIIPRSWFDLAAMRDLIARVGEADDPRNLAVACARCNQEKGRGPDARPHDPRSRAIVERLLETRLQEWRDR